MVYQSFNLVQKAEKHPLGWRNFNLSSTVTTQSVVRGATTTTAYGLLPILFLRKAVDAARARMRFLQVASQYVMPEGYKDYAIPFRKKYMADADWETSSAEFAAGTEIAWTDITTAESRIVAPTRYNYGVALSNEAIRTNALNQIQFCQEELSYKYENHIDNAIRDAICGTVCADAGGTSTEPTPMSNTVNGAHTIFGGDATDADNSLDTGDVLIPEMLLKAKRLLMSSIGYYWSGNAWTKSGVTTNPWDEGAGFVALMAPEQWESLIQDSTFLSASEYGGREGVLQGEIRQFAGIRIVVTDKMPSFSDGYSYKVTGTETDADVPGHICVMLKAEKAGAIVWGLKGEFKTFDWPNSDQIRMKLTMSYGTTVVHPDAIVRMLVSDE